MFTVTSVEGGNALLLVHHDDSSRDTRVDLLWRGETHTHTHSVSTNTTVSQVMLLPLAPPVLQTVSG